MGFAAVGSVSKYSNIFYGITIVLLGFAHWMGTKNHKKSNQVILWTSTVLVLAMFIYTKRGWFLGWFN
ncbi:MULTISPECIES: hypothetical protein [unclassified Carboxydocella]|uniref:hypothetical protein n=1 Tax=unclassified Carboxydocella TaxID=2685367 RepID=UPI0009AE53BC|nr:MULTISPECIES: hypothetical protein [unclassified Carboxydocella]